MSTPRAHAALIHAWADGAELEGRRGSSAWQSVEFPHFRPHHEYRVKPAEVEVITHLRQGATAKDMVVSEHPIYGKANARCVFDGSTGELLRVEKI
jgi:hypothetical protein